MRVDQACVPCQSSTWWHVACVVFEERSDTDGLFVKRKIPTTVAVSMSSINYDEGAPITSFHIIRPSNVYR